jgi:hypothetical protein
MIDKKQLDNVDHFNHLGSLITNDARRVREIKSRIAMAKATFKRKKKLFARKLDLMQRRN